MQLLVKLLGFLSLVLVITGSEKHVESSMENINELKRSKREIVPTLIEQVDITQGMKDQIVEIHNTFRRQNGSSDMRLMSWDDGLAQFAADHVRKCVFAHSADLTLLPFGHIGENLLRAGKLASQSSLDEVISATSKWHDEIAFYTYDDQTCQSGQQCGHYTQVVWAESHKIGCAATFCEDTNPIFKNLLVSCNYGPAGNVINSSTGRVGRPFRMGPPCSSCSNSEDICVTNLCANVNRGDQPVESSTTSSETPTSTTDFPLTSSASQSSTFTTQKPDSTTTQGPNLISTQPPEFSTTTTTGIAITQEPPSTTSRYTAQPTFDPTIYPTSNPTALPTSNPTAQPTSNPTAQPTSNPTAQPTSCSGIYFDELRKYNIQFEEWIASFQQWKERQNSC